MLGLITPSIPRLRISPIPRAFPCWANTRVRPYVNRDEMNVIGHANECVTLGMLLDANGDENAKVPIAKMNG